MTTYKPNGQNPYDEGGQAIVLPKPGQPTAQPHPYGDDGQAIPLPGQEHRIPQTPGYVPAPGSGPSTPQQGTPAPSGQPQPTGQPASAWAPYTQNGMAGYQNSQTGQWLPGDHPEAAAAGQPNVPIYPGGQPAPAAGQPGGAQAPGTTPPPTPYTATPQMQDVQRQQLLSLMTQNAVPADNDPMIKGQADRYAAAQERIRKSAENEAAERASSAGLGTSGAMDIERRSAQERAGEATGQFEAQLRQREYERRKQEIMDYMKLNAATIDQDQARMLQRELAQLDAQLRREGLSLQGSLGNRELDIRSDLGNKGLENDLMRLLLQNDQFGKDLGYRIGATEADLNRQAMMALWN